MKIIIVVLISMCLHILVYFLLQDQQISNKVIIKKDIYKTANIKYVNLKPKKIITKKVVQQKSIKKKITKKKVLKKQIQKIQARITKKINKNKVKKEIKKVIQKKEIKKVIQKKVIKVAPKKEKKVDELTQSYLNLYGKEFKNYPKETQVYLIKNLRDIGAITKIFLQYPYMSIQAHQEGVSVVEFILYPNGTISDLKVIKTSNYFLLDDNTQETINEAYSDYPRPTKPTVIRIYVKYELIYN